MKTMRNISQVAFSNPLNPNFIPCNPFSWPTFSVYVGGLWVGLFIINPKTAGGISQRLCHPACGVRPTGGKAFSPFSKTICEIAALPCFLLLFSAFPRFQFAAFLNCFIRCADTKIEWIPKALDHFYLVTIFLISLWPC